MKTVSRSGPKIDKSIDFLVDTGATYTVIHHMDAIRIGLPLAKLPRLEAARSAAGPLDIAFIENVDLTFETDNSDYGRCKVRLPAIGVALLSKEAPESARSMPSLLGMDVIACFALLVDAQADDVEDQAYMAVFEDGLIHVVRRPNKNGS